MTDKLTPIQRHKNMAAIKSKDTKPEMVVRRWLWGMASATGSTIHDCQGNPTS